MSIQIATFILLAAGFVITLFTIVWTAGNVSGKLEQRISSIEHRLEDIEHGLRRQGVTVRR